jgi:hypothetical protein
LINALAQVAVLAAMFGVLWLARRGPRALVRRLTRADAAPVRPGWAQPGPPEAEPSGREQP